MTSLGDRLTVGQVPLTHSVQVRILVAQPISRRTGTRRANQAGAGQARRRSTDSGQASHLGFFWRQQHAAEVGRFLKFAERAELGANVEVQKQKFEGPCLRSRSLLPDISQGEVAAQKQAP